MTQTTPIGKGLGRYRHFDPRNADYLVAEHVGNDVAARKTALLAARSEGEPSAQASPPPGGGDAYHWNRWIGDQGDTPMCTAYAGLGLRVAGPVTDNALLSRLGNDKLAWDAAAEFYAVIQNVDRAEGRYFSEGATMLALAKAGQARGWWGRYLWGYSVADLLRALPAGPVLLGIDVREGFFSPDRKYGLVRSFGDVYGGHAILCDGVDADGGLARLANSWGRSWGKNGHCWLPLEDLERELAAGGELLLVEEAPAP